MAKTILILGASYVGLGVAHKLLKVTLKNVKEDYKVVIVAPTSHFYWNLASVRAIIPNQIKDEQLFASIPDGLKQYGDAGEFILGIATALDPSNKTVVISSDTGKKEQKYDILIIATGSRATTEGLPWASSDLGYEDTKETLHRTQKQVEQAKTIVIGGGGPTGVEVAGELGFEYGLNKEITLVTAGSQLLVGLPPHIASFAENELRKMHVDVLKDVKVISSTVLENGKTLVTLSNKTTKEVDLYLPTIGVVPNTDFIPKELLDSKNEVVVDEFLRAKGVDDIWAAGDASALQSNQLVYAVPQTTHLNRNLDLFLHGEPLVAYKSDGAPTIGLTIGRSKGTGRYGTIKIPSLVVWWMKGRTLGVEGLPRLANGDKLM